MAWRTPNVSKVDRPDSHGVLQVQRKRGAALAAPLVLGVLVLVAILFSLCIGVYPVSWTRVLRIIASLASPFRLPQHLPWTLQDQIVVQVVRLPRVIVATMAGVGLGVSGAALQGIMRNPLVSPDLVGVTSGAAFGSVVAMFFDFSSAGVIAFGLAGGLLALTCTTLLARLARGVGTSLVVILAGIFVSAFFTSLIGIFEYVSNSQTQLPGIVYWLLGSFSGADPRKVVVITIPTLGAGSILMLLRWRINLLSLNDVDATSLSLSANRLRWFVILLVSVIVASQVSTSGGVGWVGLIVPHFARMIVGPDHRRVLPASALLGGLFTLGMDDISRTLFAQEIPVGLLTALIGTPVICFLLWRSGGKAWSYD